MLGDATVAAAAAVVTAHTSRPDVFRYATMYATPVPFVVQVTGVTVPGSDEAVC